MRNTKIITDRQVDDPIVQNASYLYDKLDRRYLDDQVTGTQRHVVDNLISGLVATWYTVHQDSVTLEIGDVVCLSGSSVSAFLVTKAIPAALANAGRALGIVLTSGAPNTDVRVAMLGVLPPSVTGLIPSDDRAVRVSTAARCESVASFSPGDFPVGWADSAANLSFNFSAGETGDGGPLTGDAGGHLTLTYPNPALANGRTTKADLRALTVRANRSEIHLAETNRPYRYDTTVGANVADNGYDCIKPTDVLLASNGRWVGLGETEVPTIAALRTLTSGYSAKVFVRAFATDGDGGGGHFIKRTGSGTDNGGTIIVPTGVTTFYYERQYSAVIDARWFGVIAYPTRTAALAGTSCTVALQAAIRAAGAITVDAGYAAPTVVLPFGFMRHGGSDYIEVSRRCQIRGQGRSSSVLMTDGLAPCVFRFNGAGLATDGGNGDYSSLRDIGIDSVTGSGSTIGLFLNAAHVVVKDVAIGAVRGKGVQIGDPDSLTNAHRFTLEGVEVNSCHGDGFYVYYGNSGSMRGCHAISAGGYGFIDESNLGNYYFGCSTEACGGPCFRGGFGTGTSYSTFVACYGEGFGSEWGPCAVVLGGLYSNTPASGDNGSALIATSASDVKPFYMVSGSSVSDITQFIAGSPDHNPSAFGWSLGYQPTEQYRLFWRLSRFAWSLSRFNTDNDLSIPFEVTGYGHARAHSQLRAPRLLLGANTQFSTGSAAPTTGIWYLGDIRWSDTGSTVGWRCTTQGAFGVARSNTHGYSLYDLITVSGFVYECVQAGTSAGSPPTFDHAAIGNLTTDGTVHWRYHGADPPLFTAIGAAGATGPTGPTGATGATGSVALAFVTGTLVGNITIGYAAATPTGPELTSLYTTFRVTSNSSDATTVTLKNAGAVTGAHIRITNASGTAFAVLNNGGTTLLALNGTGVGDPGWGDFDFDGAQWVLTAPGTS